MINNTSEVNNSRPQKINVLVLIRKKLKSDESERKYHIIRKMHAFLMFPKTKYLTKSLALFHCCKNEMRELMRTKTLLVWP